VTQSPKLTWAINASLIIFSPNLLLFASFYDVGGLTLIMANEQTLLLPQNNSRTLSQRAQPQRWGSKILSIAGIITLFVSLIMLFLRWQRASVPDVVDHDFGVGFDLTSPYGLITPLYANQCVIF